MRQNLSPIKNANKLSKLWLFRITSYSLFGCFILLTNVRKNIKYEKCKKTKLSKKRNQYYKEYNMDNLEIYTFSEFFTI